MIYNALDPKMKPRASALRQRGNKTASRNSHTDFFFENVMKLGISGGRRSFGNQRDASVK
jgi:hypothetical protein